MTLESIGKASQIQWDNLHKYGPQYKDRINYVRESLSHIPDWNNKSKLPIHGILSSDQQNIIKALTGPSRKIESLITPLNFLNKGKLIDRIYNTEKSIAFAQLAERLVDLTSADPSLRVIEIRNIIASTAIRIFKDFGSIDRFTFPQLAQSALEVATLENRSNNDSTQNFKSLQAAFHLNLDRAEGKSSSGSSIEQTQRGTLLMGMASNQIAPEISALIGFTIPGAGGAFTARKRAKIDEWKDVIRLSENIDSSKNESSDDSYYPLLAINSAILIPIELLSTRNLATGYEGSISPIPD